jgi:hypothetical protein
MPSLNSARGSGKRRHRQAGAVEGGVEAAHLAHVRHQREQRLDGPQVVGLVQGRQRDQGFKLGDHFGRQHHRAP